MELKKKNHFKILFYLSTQKKMLGIDAFKRMSGRTPHLGHDRPNMGPMVGFPLNRVVDGPHRSDADVLAYGPCKRKALANRQHKNAVNEPMGDARKMASSQYVQYIGNILAIAVHLTCLHANWRSIIGSQ